MKHTYYSNGKLLLTGEYVVLDGAKALAIPTRYGQSLEVIPSEKKGISWTSLDAKGATWFSAQFDVSQVETSEAKNATEQTLMNILVAAKKMNPDFLSEKKGLEVITRLDFPENWGLGSSSTLLNNIAQWAKVDAFKLLSKSFGGSGYDIAAAQHDSPILYQIQNQIPGMTPVSLPWNFTNKLFFVHLNRKQDSKEGIARYKNASGNKEAIKIISGITETLIRCHTLAEFEKLIQQHEAVISEIIKLPTIKERLFSNYTHSLKSSGAWGGDFILATGGEAEKEYFRNKGYHTILDFDALLK
ncbi:mevalonate kinase [Ulvibacter sp. MAR_2010_11]|uniref:GYDIA family GHMP kinase n=1 Tax=Ulvibacter sp. MAR_2010_11 TaxID=1250229 RepID=UPI000C2BCBD2|nr:GYDIA family GHMP kinase [Ulvibacter sp. MAR_2010_11]PKA82516.1 mevalonate kinase [Ulvibacter sp. MAR_2010_11]